MSDPWFSPEIAPWFSLMALVALVAYFEPFAKKGINRQLVMSTYYGLTGAALVIAIIGAVSILLGQPTWVYGTLMFAGGLTFVLMLPYIRKVAKLYDEAELRKSVANDL